MTNLPELLDQKNWQDSFNKFIDEQIFHMKKQFERLESNYINLLQAVIEARNREIELLEMIDKLINIQSKGEAQ